MEMEPYEVYIQTDENGYITAVNSSAFLSDLTAWIKIDEGYGDKYHHAQGNYLADGVFEFEHMIPLYKYVDGEVIRRTDEEVAADIAAIPVPETTSTNEERIAQLESMLEALTGVSA